MGKVWLCLKFVINVYMLKWIFIEIFKIVIVLYMRGSFGYINDFIRIVLLKDKRFFVSWYFLYKVLIDILVWINNILQKMIFYVMVLNKVNVNL